MVKKDLPMRIMLKMAGPKKCRPKERVKDLGAEEKGSVTELVGILKKSFVVQSVSKSLVLKIETNRSTIFLQMRTML